MEEMRLQKYLALCSVASRRASEEIIASGRVTVNGEKADSKELSVDDSVIFTGKRYEKEEYNC